MKTNRFGRTSSGLRFRIWGRVVGQLWYMYTQINDFSSNAHFILLLFYYFDKSTSNLFKGRSIWETWIHKVVHPSICFETRLWIWAEPNIHLLACKRILASFSQKNGWHCCFDSIPIRSDGVEKCLHYAQSEELIAQSSQLWISSPYEIKISFELKVSYLIEAKIAYLSRRRCNGDWRHMTTSFLS